MGRVSGREMKWKWLLSSLFSLFVLSSLFSVFLLLSFCEVFQRLSSSLAQGGRGEGRYFFRTLFGDLSSSLGFHSRVIFPHHSLFVFSFNSWIWEKDGLVYSFTGFLSLLFSARGTGEKKVEGGLGSIDLGHLCP